MKVLLVILPLVASQMPGSTVNVMNFDSVDANADGFIDGSEFGKWAEKRLHLKNDQIKHLFSTHDIDHDGQLHISEFVPLAFSISQKPQLTRVDVFDRLDRNQDGVIDGNERSVSGVDAMVINGLVAVADMNGDGLLTRHEFDRATDNGRQKTPEEKNRELAVQLVHDMDSNLDGRLSTTEVAQFAARFGKISSSDLSSAFGALDRNRDSFIDINELAVLPQKISTFMQFQAPPPIRSDFARMKSLKL